jgi:hypothetical protein
LKTPERGCSQSRTELFYFFDNGHFDWLAAETEASWTAVSRCACHRSPRHTGAFTDDSRTARSVLECGSPLALWLSPIKKTEQIF